VPASGGTRLLRLRTRTSATTTTSRIASPSKIHIAGPLPPLPIALPVAWISVFSPNAGVHVTVFPLIVPPDCCDTGPGNVIAIRSSMSLAS
jgi:hypothetical protein